VNEKLKVGDGSIKIGPTISSASKVTMDMVTVRILKENLWVKIT